MIKTDPAAVTKRHPNQRGPLPRVRFRCFVAHETNEQMETWFRDPEVRSQGDLIDKLVTHAKATGFNPAVAPSLPAKPIPAIKTRSYRE